MKLSKEQIKLELQNKYESLLQDQKKTLNIQNKFQQDQEITRILNEKNVLMIKLMSLNSQQRKL